MRVLSGWLKRHQVDDVHDSNPQVWKGLEEYHCGKCLESRNISSAGHDQVGITVVVRCPFPDADTTLAVDDRIIDGEPLWRRLFSGDDDVHIVPAAQAVVQQRAKCSRRAADTRA